ncbi:STE6 [Brettanomyces bruxellensis]|uniref:DEBR0S3_16402g1_1 n=1 Tax=Dekkera bruxellensis TaxID=5007 RepID=A0A7D9H0S0_DEKBR|nr:STE6 [Brettanomyces bruxellensis]
MSIQGSSSKSSPEVNEMEYWKVSDSESNLELTQDKVKGNSEHEEHITKKSFFANISSIFMFLRKDDFLLVGCGFVSAFLSALVPVGITLLVSKIFTYFTNFAAGYYTTVSEFLHDLKAVCIAVGLVGLGATVFSWLQTFIFCVLSERQQSRCRIKLYQSLLKKDFEWFENGSQSLNGELIQLNRSVEEYRSAVGEFSAMLIRSVFTVICLTVTSFIMCWRATLLIFATVPVMMAVLFIFGRFIDYWATSEDTQTSIAASILDWNLKCYVWVKSVFSADIELKKFTEQLVEVKHSFKKFNKFTSLASSLMRIFSLILFVESFWFGSYLVRKHYNTSADVISAFYACLNISMTFSSISMILVVLQKGKASFDKIVKYLDSDKSISVQSNGLVPEYSMTGNISFENVSFAFKTGNTAERRTALKNINLNIEAGEVCFLIGLSGSGKSTLSSLLLNLYIPDNGKILVDGVDINKLNKYWLRDQITFLQQFSPLFSGTIKDNIVLGCKKYTDEDLFNAVKNSCLEDTIAKLPHGLETEIGGNEGQFEPSGGEKQRIALACAFLRNTSVLILDESTSAIDIRQRKRIMENLRRIRIGRTTLIITHDIDGIHDNENVIVMSDGKIISRGKKHELVKKNIGLFKKVESRSKSYEVSNTIKAEVEDKDEQLKDLEFLRLVSNPTEKDIEDQNAKKEHHPSEFPLAFRFIKHFLNLSTRLKYFTGIVFSIGRSILSPLFSFYFSKLITGVVPQKGTTISSSYYQMKWSLVLTGISLADGLLFLFSKLILGSISDSLIQKARLDSFDKILQQPMDRLQRFAKTEMSTILMNDMRDLRTVFSGCIDSLIGGVIILCFGIIWATIIGWKLSLVGLSFFPLFGLSVVATSVFCRVAENRYKESVLSVEESFSETVNGIKVITCLNLQEQLTSRLIRKCTFMKRNGSIRALSLGMSMSISLVIINLAQAILFYYGLKLVVTSEYTLVQMMQVIMIILFSTGFSASLLGSLPNFHRGMRVARKVDGLLKLEPDSNETQGYLSPNLVAIDTLNTFEMKRVDFAYPSMPGTYILKDFNISIPKNAITCLVGESGCGKSTIISLLQRFYAPNSGEISISGYNESTIKLSHLKNSISVVPQKSYFVDASIKENLVYGNPVASTITNADIYGCLKKVNMENFVRSLPSGLDTNVGSDDKDMLISGGQAQRLCIARALLRPARIMFLDECTSALDPYNTEVVLKLLSRLKINMTIIAVTHMKDMMKIADNICMIKDGQLAETGSYDCLINKKGIFYKFLSGA